MAVGWIVIFEVLALRVLFTSRVPMEGIGVLVVVGFLIGGIAVLFMPTFPLEPKLDAPDVLSPLTFTSGIAPLEVFPFPLAVG